MKRTPGGRVKNAAVKYQKDEDLELALKRTMWGLHFEHPAWIIVLMLTGAISKEEMKLVELHIRKNKTRYPQVHIRKNKTNALFKPEEKLKSYLGWVIKNKKWGEWDKIAKMFKAGLALPKNNSFQEIDPVRNTLIRANFTLYATNFLKKRTLATKGVLLKIARIWDPEVLLGKEDADLFRIMRELDLPRSPDQKSHYFQTCVELLRPQYALLDKKKSNIH